MSDPDFLEIRQKLQNLREQLRAAAVAGEKSSQIVELDQSRVGRLSRMDALQAQAMSQASDRRGEATLKNIEASLKRIDDGDYGLCLSCDEAINRKRLEFDPTASLCIKCAENAER